MIDLHKAHLKIKEMEECLKTMNQENDNLKGKLGNVISHMGTPQDNKTENNNNFINNENLKAKNKRKTTSSVINNNTLDDLRNKFRNSNTNCQNLPFLNYPKSNSTLKDKDEDFNNDDSINNDFNNYQIQYDKKNRDLTPNNIRCNRNLTLGRQSQNQLNCGTDANSSNCDQKNDGYISHNENQNNFKINPFVDNTSTFIQQDYENINDKISNIENLENIENVNNLDEDPDNYNIVQFPVQIRNKEKKKLGR